MKVRTFINFVSVVIASICSSILFAENIKTDAPVRIRSDVPASLKEEMPKQTRLFSSTMNLGIHLGLDLGEYLKLISDLEALLKTKQLILKRINSLDAELAEEKKALKEVQLHIDKLTKANVESKKLSRSQFKKREDKVYRHDSLS